MTAQELIIELTKNQKVIMAMFSEATDDFIQFKKDEQSWSPLIAICHLVDEEKEDFRSRIQYIIANPESAPPPIDPEGWVQSRKYEQQDFQAKLNEWSVERTASLKYLATIRLEDYDKGFDHSHFGRFTVSYLMNNWLAHDLLHIRQLTRMRYYYLSSRSRHSVDYAGSWGQ